MNILEKTMMPIVSVLPTVAKRKAGRPPGKQKFTIQAENARAFVVSTIVKNLSEIMTAQLEASKGMYISEIDKETGAEIKRYREKPDLKAGEYLLNQGIGKAKETVETTEIKRLLIDF